MLQMGDLNYTMPRGPDVWSLPLETRLASLGVGEM